MYTRGGSRKLIEPLGERQRKLALMLKIGGNETSNGSLFEMSNFGWE